MGVRVYGLFVKKDSGATNSIIYYTIFKSPGTNDSGVFYLEERKKMSIDYEKLNDQIVKQAYDASSAFLTEAQRQRLFQNKIDRAAAMIRAQEQFGRMQQEQ
jgi:hypothetical protein